MARLIAGLQVAGDIADMGFVYGIGLSPGIWKLSEAEAEVFARIIARKADEGSTAAIAQIEKLVDYSDYVAAASIGIGKVIETVTEVKTNGFNPFWLPKSDTASGGNNGGGGKDR